jgi:hypothetical protein
MPCSSYQPAGLTYQASSASSERRYVFDSGGRPNGTPDSRPISTTLPVKPSSRSVAAAFPPARPAPTTTSGSSLRSAAITHAILSAAHPNEAAKESNLPIVGLPRPAGFEDPGHRIDLSICRHLLRGWSGGTGLGNRRAHFAAPAIGLGCCIDGFRVLPDSRIVEAYDTEGILYDASGQTQLQEYQPPPAGCPVQVLFDFVGVDPDGTSIWFSGFGISRYDINSGALITASGQGDGCNGPAASGQIAVCGGPPSTLAPPTASFTYSPASPVTGSSVTFDGSASTCPDAPCSYSWSDDGSPTSPARVIYPLLDVAEKFGTRSLLLPRNGPAVDEKIVEQILEDSHSAIDQLVLVSTDRALVASMRAATRLGVHTVALGPPEQLPVRLSVSVDEPIDATELASASQGLIGPGDVTKAMSALTYQFSRAKHAVLVIDPYVGARPSGCSRGSGPEWSSPSSAA